MKSALETFANEDGSLPEDVQVINRVVTSRTVTPATLAKIEAMTQFFGLISDEDVNTFFIGVFGTAIKLGFQFPAYGDDPQTLLEEIERTCA